MELKFKKLPKVFKKKWVAALRSGKYCQGFGSLVNFLDDIEDYSKATYCCLGVACTIQGIKPNELSFIPEKWKKVPKALRGDQGLPGLLASLNDGSPFEGVSCKKRTFKRIATWIEKNL